MHSLQHLVTIHISVWVETLRLEHISLTSHEFVFLGYSPPLFSQGCRKFLMNKLNEVLHCHAERLSTLGS